MRTLKSQVNASKSRVNVRELWYSSGRVSLVTPRLRLAGATALIGLLGAAVHCTPGSVEPTGAGGAMGGGSGGIAPALGGAPSSGGSSLNEGGAPSDAGAEVKVTPVQRDGKYVLAFGSIVFEVDPAAGGRVVTFAYDGTDVLADTEETESDVNYGSTFWPSPQSAWQPEWPPLPELDSEAYSAAIEEDSIVLTSPAAPSDSERPRLRVSKRFTAVAGDEAVDCAFTLTNDGAEPSSWAAWQVSRVASGGVSFFPTGAGAAREELEVTEDAGLTWYEHETWHSGKYIADGSGGWLAHAGSGLLFVKRFADVTPERSAPDEGDVAIYASDKYVELEPQGPYIELEPGASLSWTVRWYLRRLPDGVPVRVGEAALSDLARQVVSGGSFD